MAWGLAVVVAGTLAATRLRVENPGGHWAPKERSPEARLWDLARDQFGYGEVALVALRLPEGVTPSPESTGAFEEWLDEQPEVKRSFGLRDVREFERSPVLGLLLGGRIRAMRDAVVNTDQGLALVYVTVRAPEQAGGLENKVALFARIHTSGESYLPEGSELFIAGKPAADVALNDLLRRDTLFSAPVAFTTMAIVLMVVFGRLSFGPFLGAAAAVVIVAGGLALFGAPVSTATAVTLPITVVVGLAYGVHMAAAVERTRDVALAMRELSRPLRWAFLTTTAALLSFALSPFPALRSYAYASSAGIAVGYLAAFTLVPHLSGSIAGRTRRGRSRWKHFAVQLFVTSARRPRVTFAVWCGLAVVAAFGLFRLRMEPNNYLGFFPANHPTLAAHRTLDAAFGGSLPMFVLARVDSGNAYRRRDVRVRLREFMGAAGEDLRVGSAFTPFVAPGRSREFLEQWFQGADARYTRAVFSVPLMETTDTRDLLARLDSLAVAHSDGDITLQVTGPLAAGLPLLHSLVQSQIRSLAVVLVVVGVAFAVAVRSTWIGALLFFPNLLAPLAVGATMGFAGIGLDFMMVVVFSMVLGIAVDDTLQLVMAGVPVSGRGTFSAVRAVRRVATPVTLTSLASVIGFGSLALSPFPVTGRLGILMAVGLAVAWLADLSVTPLLLAGRRVGARR
ncbi:MAG: MMPL family transporter [Gemmatimonadetes bacterium]|nr:MMPL family transporter [Gemmatimonadota bacterium]